MSENQNQQAEIAQIADTLSAKLTDVLLAIKDEASVPKSEKLCTKDWIRNYLDVSASTINRIISDPTFPKPLVLSSTTIRWYRSEVFQWMATQNNQRRKRKPKAA